jgi:hypothetical protein
MIVKELIEKLKKLDEGADVILYDPDWDHCSAVDSLFVVSEECDDPFDGNFKVGNAIISPINTLDEMRENGHLEFDVFEKV